MRIERFEVGGFGRLRGVSGEGLDDAPVVVIHGDNESGKSTFFEFLVSTLFGFAPASLADHPFRPRSGTRLGGRLVARLRSGERCEVSRQLAPRPAGVVATATGEIALGNEPAPLVGAVSRAVYRDLLALSADDLAAVGGDTWSAIESRLLEAGGLLPARSARDVVRDLERAAAGLWRPDRRGRPRHAELMGRLEELRRRRRRELAARDRLRERTSAMPGFSELPADARIHLGQLESRERQARARVELLLQRLREIKLRAPEAEAGGEAAAVAAGRRRGPDEALAAGLLACVLGAALAPDVAFGFVAAAIAAGAFWWWARRRRLASDEARAAETRARRRAKLDAERQHEERVRGRLRRRLVTAHSRLAGAMADREAFEGRLAALDTSGDPAAGLARLESARREAAEAAGRGDTFDVAAADGEIQALEEEARELERRRDRLVMLARIVEEAASSLRSRLRPRVLSRAARIVRTLTDGRYVELGEAANSSPWAGLTVRAAGGFVPEPVAAPLSRATREQIWLAYRLALAEELEGEEPLPLVLDEALAGWDARRQERMARVLARVGETRQVFLLTCHREVAERMVRGAGAKVIELESREEAGEEEA